MQQASDDHGVEGDDGQHLVAGEVGVAEQQQRQAQHEECGADLRDVGDRHRTLALVGQDDQAQNEVGRRDGDENPDGKDSADHQGETHHHLAGPIGDGVEHGAEVRHLIEPAGGEAVDPVRCPQRDEHHEGPEVLVPYEHEQHKKGHEQDETGERDRVRHVQNPLALRVRCRGVHPLRVSAGEPGSTRRRRRPRPRWARSAPTGYQEPELEPVGAGVGESAEGAGAPSGGVGAPLGGVGAACPSAGTGSSGFAAPSAGAAGAPAAPGAHSPPAPGAGGAGGVEPSAGAGGVIPSAGAGGIAPSVGPGVGDTDEVVVGVGIASCEAKAAVVPTIPRPITPHATPTARRLRKERRGGGDEGVFDDSGPVKSMRSDTSDSFQVRHDSMRRPERGVLT
ncbi:protein of unknown function [Agreia sp. COWG]|nr:protein of unknown function [Agreia sp. COWG]